MLLYEGHSQGVEKHAFADDGYVRDAGGGDKFTECERIELEDGIDDGGNSESSDDGNKEPEVFLCGGVVPEDEVGARVEDDHKDRYNEESIFDKIQTTSYDDEGDDADRDVPYGIQYVEKEAKTRFLVVFIENFCRMP